jgi:hypothetical protein
MLIVQNYTGEPIIKFTYAYFTKILIYKVNGAHLYVGNLRNVGKSMRQR